MNKTKLFLIVSFFALVMFTLILGDSPKALGTSAAEKVNETCAECHEELVGEFHKNTHGRIRDFEVADGEVGCVSCHENGMKHAEEGGDPEVLASFKTMGAEEASDKCLSCHQDSAMAHWQSSGHGMGDVSCTSCHNIHSGSMKPATELCYSCHSDVEAEMMLPSHHPVTEGKMSCTSCHNPHGSPADNMIKSDERLNDLCLSCHAQYQGPFIFEHAPVVEDCGSCHSPHGSIANNMLTENEPFLCLQCHEMHFHTGAVGMPTTTVVQRGEVLENPHTKDGWKMAFATKCTQCHVTIHGSDLPSQGITSMGKSLTR